MNRIESFLVALTKRFEKSGRARAAAVMANMDPVWLREVGISPERVKRGDDNWLLSADEAPTSAKVVSAEFTSSADSTETVDHSVHPKAA